MIILKYNLNVLFFCRYYCEILLLRPPKIKTYFLLKTNLQSLSYSFLHFLHPVYLWLETTFRTVQKWSLRPLLDSPKGGLNIGILLYLYFPLHSCLDIFRFYMRLVLFLHLGYPQTAVFMNTCPNWLVYTSSWREHLVCPFKTNDPVFRSQHRTMWLWDDGKPPLSPTYPEYIWDLAIWKLSLDMLEIC